MNMYYKYIFIMKIVKKSIERREILSHFFSEIQASLELVDEIYLNVIFR